MKNILKSILLSSVALLAISCEPEYEPLNHYSDVSWYTSQFRNKEFTAAVGNYISFSDLSQGTLGHSWTIQKGDYFLKGEIPRKEKEFEKYINYDLDTISSEASAHVLFSSPGLREVTLRNVFRDSVTYCGWDTLGATYENGNWVIDTTFTVDVYDSIQSAFKVYQYDYETLEEKLVLDVPYTELTSLKDSASWQTVEVMSGTSLKFVDMTKVGRPTSRSWVSGGGTPATSADSISEMSYMFLRNYFAQVQQTRSGAGVPGGYAAKYIPLKIKCVESTLPLEILGAPWENEDETISFSIKGALEDFEEEENNFEVHVTNADAGFDDVIPVELAKSEGDKVTLKLAAPIYNTDVITVKYKGGNILSVDDRTLEPFEATLVEEMHVVQLLTSSAYSFENSDVNVWKGLHNCNALFIGYSDEQVHTGSRSFKVKVNTEANKNSVSSAGAMFNVPKAGVYVYSYWMYMDVETNPGSLFTWVLKPDWTFAVNCWQSTKAYPVKQWVKVEREIELEETDGVIIQLRAPDTQEGSHYYDDFSLFSKEYRPAN